MIGLAGYAGVGKDETGCRLEIFGGFRRRSFAAPLRAEVARWARRREWPPEMPPELCTETLGISPQELYQKPTSERARKLLQWWGTDFRRAARTDYWIQKAQQSLALNGNYAWTDVRFLNEAEWVWRQGGCVWLVKRPGLDGADPHASEQLPPLLEPLIRHRMRSSRDRIVHNDGDLIQLDTTVRELLRSFE